MQINTDPDSGAILAEAFRLLYCLEYASMTYFRHGRLLQRRKVDRRKKLNRNRILIPYLVLKLQTANVHALGMGLTCWIGHHVSSMVLTECEG